MLVARTRGCYHQGQQSQCAALLQQHEPSTIIVIIKNNQEFLKSKFYRAYYFLLQLEDTTRRENGIVKTVHGLWQYTYLQAKQRDCHGRFKKTGRTLLSVFLNSTMEVSLLQENYNLPWSTIICWFAGIWEISKTSLQESEYIYRFKPYSSTGSDESS